MNALELLRGFLGHHLQQKGRDLSTLSVRKACLQVCSIYGADAGGHQLGACFTSSALKHSAWFEIHKITVSFSWRLSYSPTLELKRKKPWPLLADQKEQSASSPNARVTPQPGAGFFVKSNSNKKSKQTYEQNRNQN